MGRMDRYDGTCLVCNANAPVRQIEIATIGSEGTRLCHSCEMEVVRFIQGRMNERLTERRDAHLAKRDQR